MKRFKDLSKEEKANLDEDKVQYYAKLECANKGVIIPQKPINKVTDIPPATKKFYRVGYESFVFKNEQDAQDFIDARNKGLATSNMGSDYSDKEIYIKNDLVEYSEIKTITAYTREEADELKETIKNNSTIKKEWGEYEKSLKEYKNIEEDIWLEIEEILHYNSRVAYYEKIYKDYLELAEGNNNMALTFFTKAYKDVSLSDVDRGIVNNIIHQPLEKCEEVVAMPK